MPQCQCYAPSTGKQCRNNVKNGNFCHLHKNCQQIVGSGIIIPNDVLKADFYVFRDFVDNFIANDKTPIGNYSNKTGRYQKWAEEAEKYQVSPDKKKTIEEALKRFPDNIVPQNATQREKEVAYEVWEWLHLLKRFYNDGDIYGINEELGRMRYIDAPEIEIHSDDPIPDPDSPKVREYERELNAGVDKVVAYVHFILEKYKILAK